MAICIATTISGLNKYFYLPDILSQIFLEIISITIQLALPLLSVHFITVNS